MNILALRMLVEVARRGSFAEVARRQNIAPSIVSRTVAGLESEIGVRLFHRTTRRLSLTEAGARYMRRIEAVVEELDDAGTEALAGSATAVGTLRITASVAFGQVCLMPVLGAFRMAFPDIRLELLLTDENLDLLAYRIDLAIRLAPEVQTHMARRKLFATHYRVCASPAYLSAHNPIRKPGDLASHDALLFSLPKFRERWLFRHTDGRVEEVPVSGSLQISNALALRDCMLAGFGPALLADWLIESDIQAGRCEDLFPDKRVAATSFETAAWLVYPTRRLLPKKVQVMLAFLSQQLGKP